MERGEKGGYGRGADGRRGECVCVRERGMGGRAGGRRAVLRILPDVWNEL